MSEATATDSRWVVTTIPQVAAFFGKKRRAVDEWKNHGMPWSKGRYDLSAITAWLLERRENSAGHSPRVGGDELNGHDENLQQRMELAEVLKAEADAALKMVKLRASLGELVERAIVEADIRTLFNQVRHRLQAIPEEVAGSFPPDVRLDLTLDLTTKLELVLQELAECPQSPPCSLPIDEPDSSPPPEKTSGKSRAKRAGSGTAAKRSSRSKNRPSSRGRAKKS